jgi:hypothetical protein
MNKKSIAPIHRLFGGCGTRVFFQLKIKIINSHFMKKVTTFFLLISALAFVGCEKESAPDCTKATVRFTYIATAKWI